MPPFIEIGSEQRCKHGQTVCGDLFLSRRLQEESRIISVLADGLGSGIKASVLSTLTGAMAARCVRGNMGVQQTAQLILSTLPVCRQRGLAYSTFTIVDVNMTSGEMRVIEHENPRFFLIRNGETLQPAAETLPLAGARLSSRHHQLLLSRLQLQEEDRVVFFSDGITQSGLGRDRYVQGWGDENVRRAALEYVRTNSEISAQDLSARLLHNALAHDAFTARDDMTCAALYYRQPRHLLVVTGPPYDPDNDAVIARKVREFQGRTLVCGGTTASVIAREWGVPVEADGGELDPRVPPPSKIYGVDLVTEGSLTLEEILRLVTHGHRHHSTENAATRAAGMMLRSDRIHFVVGSRVNNAHHDPESPRQLDIRRNIVRKLRRALEEKYLKETTMELT